MVSKRRDLSVIPQSSQFPFYFPHVPFFSDRRIAEIIFEPFSSQEKKKSLTLWHVSQFAFENGFNVSSETPKTLFTFCKKMQIRIYSLMAK